VLTGCYRIPAVKIDVTGVYTHKMSTDAYRGAGRPEATYLIERLMDVIAREVGVDRPELRLKQFPLPHEVPFPTACGDTYGSRGMVVGGSAIVMSIDKVLAKAKTFAAHLFETTADHVECANGKFTAPGVSNREIAWPEIAVAAYVAKSLPPGVEPGLEASSFFEPGNFTYPFGAHICAVDVDRE